MISSSSCSDPNFAANVINWSWQRDIAGTLIGPPPRNTCPFKHQTDSCVHSTVAFCGVMESVPPAISLVKPS